MLFEDYWNKVCEKNTAFKNKEQVTIKVSSIKRLMEQSYDMGVEDVTLVENSNRGNKKYSDNECVDALKNLFGMK